MNLFLLAFLSFALYTSTFSTSLVQQVASGQEPTREVETTWTGLKFQVLKVKRIDAKHAVVSLRLITNSSAPNSTFLGSWSEPVEASGTNNQVTRHPLPFSLMGASLIDQASKKKYSAVRQPPGEPRYGVTEIITTMHPGAWLLMSVDFELPQPAPNSNGIIPIQKVDVMLPKAKGLITDLIVSPM